MKNNSEQFRYVNEMLEPKQNTKIKQIDELKHYYELINDLPNCVYHINRKGEMQFANKAFLKRYKFKLKDILGTCCNNNFPKKLADKYNLDDERVMNSGKKYSFIEENINPNTGQRGFVEVVKSPLKNKKGDVVGLQCMFWDITDKIIAERNLRRAEDWLEIISKHSPVKICVVDARGKVLFVQSQGGQVIIDSIFDVCKGESRSTSERTINDNLSRVFNKRENVLFYIYASDGDCWAYRISPIVREDSVYSAVCFITDVTKQKKLEKEARYNDNYKTLGILIGGVAHDFNNLLTVILGYAELVLTHVGKDVKEIVIKDVEQIMRAANRCVTLNKQLLSSSGKESHLKKYPYDVSRVIANMHKMLKKILESEINLSIKIHHKELMVECDASQIEQIVMNLVLNARDSIPDKGEIIVSVKRQVVDNIKNISNGEYCVLEVEDNGSGIDASILPYIFKPFFTSKSANKGTGLGLVNVKNIVESLDGKILIDTEVNKGSKLSIYLPITHAYTDDEVGNQKVYLREIETSKLIFIIDDDRDLRNLVSRLVLYYGFGIVALTSHDDLRKALKSYQPDMILINYAQKAGLDECIKKQIVNQNQIAYIANVNDDIKSSSIDEERILNKPFTSSELIGLIKNLLQ